MIRFLSGNHVTLLRNGTEYFSALEQAINAAQHEIFLETYIYEPDVIGLKIAEALKRAVARGVKVFLLLDGFGCKDLRKKFVRDLRDTGVEVLFYRPKVSPWTLKRNRLRRLHRKLSVIDGRIGFVGGINIIDDMNTPGHTPPRIDYAVRVEGALLVPMRISMRKLWRRVAWVSLRQITVSRSVMDPIDAGNMRAAFVVRDNVWHRRDIEQAYLEAIENARSEIMIANSYFLPGLRFRRALVAAARRGVRVMLLLQARVEYVLLDYASRALYEQLLGAGIEIFEYHASFMHSKVAVIDGYWATVGSSNIDPFSLMLSREANVVVEDAGFAELLRRDIQKTIESGARCIRREDWKHAPFIRRLLAWVTYGLIRFMLGMIGYPDKR
jgi:cardiolipin synthase